MWLCWCSLLSRVRRVVNCLKGLLLEMVMFLVCFSYGWMLVSRCVRVMCCCFGF